MDLNTTPNVLDAVKLADYVRHRDAIRETVGASAACVLWDGGDLEEYINAADPVFLPKAFGTAGASINGANLWLLPTVGGEVVLDVVARREPNLGAAVTCTIDLWDVSTGAIVPGSVVTIALNDDADTPAVSGPLTFSIEIRRYAARIRSSNGIGVSARVRVLAWGA